MRECAHQGAAKSARLGIATRFGRVCRRHRRCVFYSGAQTNSLAKEQNCQGTASQAPIDVCLGAVRACGAEGPIRERPNKRTSAAVIATACGDETSNRTSTTAQV